MTTYEILALQHITYLHEMHVGFVWSGAHFEVLPISAVTYWL